jgi:hypothetical protein
MKQKIVFILIVLFNQLASMEKDTQHFIIQFPSPTNEPTNIAIAPKNSLVERMLELTHVPQQLQMNGYDNGERIPLLPRDQPHHRLVNWGNTTYECCPETYEEGACSDRCKCCINGTGCGSLCLCLGITTLKTCSKVGCICCVGSGIVTVSGIYIVLGLIGIAPCITDRAYTDAMNSTVCDPRLCKLQWCIKRYNNQQRNNNNNNDA